MYISLYYRERERDLIRKEMKYFEMRDLMKYI